MQLPVTSIPISKELPMKRLTLGALALALAVPATAQQMSAERAAMLTQYDDAWTKLIQLAEAMPAEKYTWRPAAGVRSVSEVFMHVAIGNHFVARAAGVEPAVQMTQGMESGTTDKAQVIAFMRGAADHVRNALRAVPDADLNKATKLFGADSDYRGVYMLLVTHAHEHLGQSIAYARMNGVTPPWSGN
jgi:uncharacterized damage-inducible protein DinB